MNFLQWVNKFLKEPGHNDADSYGVTVSRIPIPQVKPYYRVIGIHHLTPEENQGLRHIFLDVLDENGNRMKGQKVGWSLGNEARQQPVTVDKPDDEPGTNIVLYAGQFVDVWVEDGPSDRVNGMQSLHQDERDGKGRLGNSLGHHSFLVVFQRVVPGFEPVTIPAPTPEPVPATTPAEITITMKMTVAPAAVASPVIVTGLSSLFDSFKDEILGSMEARGLSTADAEVIYSEMTKLFEKILFNTGEDA